MTRRDPYDMFRRQAHGAGYGGRPMRDPRGLTPEMLEQILRDYARMEQDVRTLREERDALLRREQQIAQRFEEFREEFGRRDRALQRATTEVDAERTARRRAEEELARVRDALVQGPVAEQPEARDFETEHKALSKRFTELQADMKRLQERHDADLAKARAAGAEAALGELLDMADNLDRAIGSAPDTDSAWFTGLVALRKQLMASLQRQGIERFGQVGEQFDPHTQEATGTRPATPELPRGLVVSVERAGYRRADGSLLRPAHVVVAG